MLRNLSLGKAATNDPAWREVLQLASEGLELLYSRGRIDQNEYTRRLRSLKELRGRVANQDA